MDKTVLIVVALFIAAFAFTIGADVGKWTQKGEDERQAVVHGAAHYTLNPTNGTTTWEWNK